MKKLKCFFLAILILSLGIVNNSCMGTFKLTHKTHEWNSSVGGKWANTFVFWALVIVPVYEVVIFLDSFVFNVIEFWSGDNPISMNEGDEEIQIVKSGNKEYMITATKNKFHIEQVKGPNKGEFADIIFNPEENSCYLEYEGEKTKLVEYIHSENGSDQVKLFLPDDNTITMDASMRNLDVIQSALQSDAHFMAEKIQD